MLSIRFSWIFLPVGKDFTIPAANFLPVGKGLQGSPAKVTRRHDGTGHPSQLCKAVLPPSEEERISKHPTTPFPKRSAVVGQTVLFDRRLATRNRVVATRGLLALAWCKVPHDLGSDSTIALSHDVPLMPNQFQRDVDPHETVPAELSLYSVKGIQ